jgi:hypothetical protein
MPAIKSRAGILALLLFSGAAPAAATGLRFVDTRNGIVVIADWFLNGIFVNDFPVQKGPGYDNVGTITLPRNQTIRFRARFDTDYTNRYPPAKDGTSVFYIVPRKGSTQIDGMMSYTLSTSGETHSMEGWFMGKTNPLLPVSVPDDTPPTHVFVGAFAITNGTPGSLKSHKSRSRTRRRTEP